MGRERDENSEEAEERKQTLTYTLFLSFFSFSPKKRKSLQVPEMIAMISDIVAAGHGYVSPLSGDRREQARRRRLCAVEVGQARGADVGEPLGPRKARVAHRVLGDGSVRLGGLLVRGSTEREGRERTKTRKKRKNSFLFPFLFPSQTFHTQKKRPPGPRRRRPRGRRRPDAPAPR